MSAGAVIGGIAGGAIGFVVGGFAGAAIGVGLGAGLGMLIDPVQPDAPTPGDPGDVTLNFAKEGAPFADLLGTPKLNGGIVWAGEERVQEVKTEQEGGKGGGGSQEVSAGNEFFLDWAVNFGRGPLDKLYTIYANEKVVWSGDLARPVSGGMVTLALDGMGAADFYFGTADQAANAYMGPKLPDPTLNTAYRGQIYMVLKDCSLGNYNRAPSMFIIAQKSPSFEAQGLLDEYKDIDTFDYNPSHALYYVLNKMADIGSLYLNSIDFNDVALKLKGESRGLSINFGTFREALSYIESITRHISGGVRWGIDSKIHPFLFRKTNNVESLIHINPEDLQEKPALNRKTWLDTINEMRIQYNLRIFRAPTCPTGIDNLVIDSSEIEAGETRQLTIQNENWTLEGCDDISFLSDGLASTGEYITAGTFWGMIPLGGGKWQINYRANSELCDNQEDTQDPDCPTIGGVKIPCCSCDKTELMSIDKIMTPDSIAPGGSINVYLDDGLGPFTWETLGAVGYSFTAAQTGTRQNVLNCSSGTCGLNYDSEITIKVTDSCGTEDTYTIRNTGAGWHSQIGWRVSRESTGPGDCGGDGDCSNSECVAFMDGTTTFEYSVFDFSARLRDVTELPGCLWNDVEPYPYKNVADGPYKTPLQGTYWAACAPVIRPYPAWSRINFYHWQCGGIGSPCF